MNADVDMSGRVEETNKSTVLAIANGITYSILISGRDKRNLIAQLDKQKPERRRAQVHILVFSSLLFLLLKPTITAVSRVYIDTEYPSHDAVIKNRVLALLKASGMDIDKNKLVFQLVGKQSPAHKIAYMTFKGTRKADRILTVEDILKIFEK